jgi:ribosome-associated translation inhibitor RaiA
MNVEYTGRHYEITPAVRTEIETGLLKIRKILRDKFETKVVLTLERRRNKPKSLLLPATGR